MQRSKPVPSAPRPMTLEDLLAQADWIRGLARSIVRDGAEAEDVAQEALLVAGGQLGTGEGVSRPWIAGVVRNIARSRTRRRREKGEREARSSAGQRALAAAPSALDDAQLLERQRLLLEHVDALPPAQRKVVLLRFYDGLPPREIAKVTDAPVATVNSRIQRALEALRTRLDAEFGERRGWAVFLAPLAQVGSAGAGAKLAGAGAAGGWLIAAMALLVLSLGGAAARLMLAETGDESVDEVQVGRLSTEATSTGLAAPVPVSGVARVEPPLAPATEETNTPPAGPLRLVPTGVIDVATLSSPPDAQKTGELVVRCFEEGTDQPVADLPVRLYAKDVVLFHPPEARRTDRHGAVRWDGLAPGSYSVLHSAVEVVAGGTAELVVETPLRDVIRGRVIDLKGEPVPGAQIHEAGGARAVSDQDGRFEVVRIEQASSVYATASGFERSTRHSFMSWGQRSEEVVLHMERGGGSVEGVVVNHLGVALAGLSVRLRELESHEPDGERSYGTIRTRTRTDAAGRYRFEGLLPVRSRLEVSFLGLPQLLQECEIEAGQNQILDLRLPRPSAIQGVVSAPNGTPVQGARVIAYAKRTRGTQSVTTDALGQYRIENPAPDVDHMRAYHSIGGMDSSFVRLTAGTDETVDFTLPHDPTATERVLRGALRDPSGAPLEGWEIVAFSQKDEARGIDLTNDSGSFSLQRDRAWVKHLSVAPFSSTRRAVQSFLNVSEESGFLDLVVDHRPASVRVTLTDVTGALPTGSQAVLSLALAVYERKRIDLSGGRFVFDDLGPGWYELSVEAPDRARLIVPFKLAPGEDLDLGELVLGRGGRVEVFVEGAKPHDFEGRSFVGFVSWASAPGFSSHWTPLGADGSGLDAVPSGRQFLCLLLPGQGIRCASVDVIEGGAVTVHLPRLEQYGANVRATANGLPTGKLRNGGIAVAAEIESLDTGALAGWQWLNNEGSTFRLPPLAPGRYRLNAFSLEGRSGTTIFTVEAGSAGEELATLDMRWPGS